MGCQLLMGWSAASPVLGDPPPGNEFVSYPATPPVALLGERRAAPPGTRRRETFASSSGKTKKVAKHQRRHPMELHTIGIDLGKTVFHLVGLNPRGEVVVRKKFSRKQLLHFTANLQLELIGMEACGGSHFLGRALREQ